MDDLSELKAIWCSAKTDDLPTSSEMVRLIKKFRSQKITKKIVLIVLACISTIVMVGIIIMVDAKLLTTPVGELLIVAASVLLGATNIRSIKRFYNAHNSNNKEFLQFIEQTRLNQIYYYKKTQFVGLLLCSVGLLLFLYEPLCQDPQLFIPVYALAIVYLIVMWFVIRPRKFKKGIQQLEATRERLEKILNQLN
jgi:hypothetical protein